MRSTHQALSFSTLLALTNPLGIPRFRAQTIRMQDHAKIYMAGPDVFSPHHEEIFRTNKALLHEAGLVPLSPLDNEIAPGLTKERMAEAIYLGNMKLIHACDAVFANLNDFRGDCIDDGTSFEIGAAAVLGKRIIGYRSNLTSLVDRLGERDKNGEIVEDFAAPVNLMIQHSILQSGGTIVQGGFAEALHAYRAMA